MNDPLSDAYFVEISEPPYRPTQIARSDHERGSVNIWLRGDPADKDPHERELREWRPPHDCHVARTMPVDVAATACRMLLHNG